MNYSPHDPPLLDTSHKLSDLLRLLSGFFIDRAHTRARVKTRDSFHTSDVNRMAKTSKAMRHTFKSE